jgi:hypothetical protein
MTTWTPPGKKFSRRQAPTLLCFVRARISVIGHCRAVQNCVETKKQNKKRKGVATLIQMWHWHGCLLLCSWLSFLYLLALPLLIAKEIKNDCFQTANPGNEQFLDKKIEHGNNLLTQLDFSAQTAEIKLTAKDKWRRPSNKGFLILYY